MASDSQANAKRKRLAAKKLDQRAVKAAKKTDETDVAYGLPSELGSGSQFGSAKKNADQPKDEE